MIDEIESEDIYDFLEQSGVKGMRWGVRKTRSSSKSSSKPKSASKLSKSQKIGIAAIGGAVGIIGARFMRSRGLNVPISLAFGGASAYAGATAVHALVEKYGDQTIQVRGEVK